MKNVSKILWGVVLIVIGLIYAINALDIMDINIFFKGWWTLFIIVPSLIGLFDEKDRQGSLIGLFIGVILLLAVRDVISFELVLKLIIPFVLVVIGLSIIWSEISGSKVKEKVEASKKHDLDEVAAVLNEEIRLIDGDFKGATIDAIFGHGVLDIRKAKLEEGAAIKANAIFGSVDIIVPQDTEVKIKATKIFGGVERTTFASDSKKKKSNVIYIEAYALFGGINIK